MISRARSKYRLCSSRTVSGSRVADRVVKPTRSAKSTLTTRRSVVCWGDVAEGTNVPVVDPDPPGPSSSATSRVPQLPQKRAPATIGAPQVGQPRRVPHRTQNLASGRFSVEQLEQITAPDCTPRAWLLVEDPGLPVNELGSPIETRE